MSLAEAVHSAVQRNHPGHRPHREKSDPGGSSQHFPSSAPPPSHGHSNNTDASVPNTAPIAHELHPAVGDTKGTVQYDAPLHNNQGHSFGQGSSHYHKSPPDTPATRTGPPRSLSFAQAFPHSPSRHNSGHQYELSEGHPSSSHDDDAEVFFSQTSTDFRGALESLPSRDQVLGDRKGKRRESRGTDDGWITNRFRWLTESPKNEHSQSAIPWKSQEQDNIKTDGDSASRKEDGNNVKTDEDQNSRPEQVAGFTDRGERPAGSQLRVGLRRAFSLPHTHSDNKTGKARWARLRSLFPNLPSHDHGSPLLSGSSTTPQTVNITDELITGGLSTLMLRLWFERDEKGHRRVPILLHRLRIRISDSYHPTEEQRTSFRIECEYGAARWVVYRQLRDFFSLHTHYTVSNVYNRLGDELPEFPLTSIPYLKFLKKGDGHIDQASFARLQREALETYLIKLIRAVMFHPSSNRLSGFLEVSALSIALAHSGGAQYKGGYLQIHAVNNGGGGFGRKGLGWKAKKEFRWCAVRDNYLVVHDEPGELSVWDVFLFDPDFRIEQPKRYYRQGLNNILHNERAIVEHHFVSPDKPQFNGHINGHTGLQGHHDSDGHSLINSIKSRISGILHLHPGHGQRQNHDIQSDVHKSEAGGESTRDSGSMSSVSLPPRPRTPMLDPSTTMHPMAVPEKKENAGTDKSGQREKTKEKQDVSKHTFYIVNSQMRLKLFARSERQMLQWITALERSASSSHYTGRNRFDSFAPIRLNVAAQWLVDGRDYFWNLSRAILLAREVIYIHDWWLSPELLMRRPNKEKYRLDHLLERKAKEGVKIYIILYQEVSNRTTPTDSNYAKQRLMGLHTNIMVQRSPSHFQTGTFYWAHHEKFCIIDQAIAFMGGIDLCFGRWDTPQHALVDDVDGTDQPEIWPGKDYSNPRIADFYNLNKPEEDMYDRTKNPRMPWHDVAMQVVGQPARDLARHFVQRWNYLLRIKNHTRVMPFLLPPPEFRPGELTQMGLTGTCEMQICRSAGPWSMGTPVKIEQSIQNAYLKAIQLSEHFVYIENQFFITSTVVNDVKIENNIGDAIVHRIRKAHRDRTPWKCCIVIPLLPGFTFPVDHSDASAIRIILECQNRTIARGPNSIFSRLRKEGIDPDEYITVFSLRNWARMRGDILATEQVYIHGKVCIVDDRLAIIGSANINERSQRGDRDSEVAAVIRDTDMIDGTMAGQPFKVGRFAHTLRVRLMREHLGVNVDALGEEDLMANEPVRLEHEQQPWDPDDEQQYQHGQGREIAQMVWRLGQPSAAGIPTRAGLSAIKQAFTEGEDSSAATVKELHEANLLHHNVSRKVGGATHKAKCKDYAMEGKEKLGFASSTVPTAEEETIAEDRRPLSLDTEALANRSRATTIPGEPEARRQNAVDSSSTSKPVPTDDQAPSGVPGDTPTRMTDIGSPQSPGQQMGEEQEDRAVRNTLRRGPANRHGTKWTVPIPRPHVDPEAFEDPISDEFWRKVWTASAAYNTEIYRKVFHAIPDDTITTWKQYKEFVVHHERLKKSTTETDEPVVLDTGDDVSPAHEKAAPQEVTDGSSEASKENYNENSQTAPKRTRGSEPFDKGERDEMEKLLKELNGHLVIYPTRFLEDEDIANNFIFNADRLLPLPIYD